MLKKLKIILTFVLLIQIGNLYGQARNAEFEIHNRGELWETMKDDGSIGAPDATDRYEYYPSMDWPGGPAEMSKDDQRSYMVAAGIWIGGKNADGSIFLTENGPFSNVDEGEFQELEVVNNFVGTDGYDPSEAEQIITAQWTTTQNISCKRVSRVWSFRDINNLVLMEYTFTNNNSTTLTDVYFGFVYLIRPSYQDYVVHNGWGDDYNRTDDYVKYDEELKLLYSYDDTPNYSLPTDVGNYWDDADELRTPGYAGYSLIYNDPVDDNSDQPSNVLYAQLLDNQTYVSSEGNTITNLYAILNGEDRSLQADEDDHLTPFMLMSVGPYTLSPGESVKIVTAEAVNGLSLSEAMTGIDAQSLLPAGEDSLKTTIQNAKALYENNYAVSEVPPPSPDLDIVAVPEEQTITVSWDPVDENWVNPIDNKSNFMEYRIYRSEVSFIGPYERLKKIKPSKATDVSRYFDEDLQKWVYEDQSISLGSGYYYTVTSVDSNGVESWYTNRNEQAVYASRSPAENALDVKVFPNPFKVKSGFLVSGQEDSIVWTNLPAVCTVRIYTSSGELVKTLEHNDQSSGEETWNQLSNARQRIASGIYFWTVESSVGNAKGTLLIIK